MYFGIAGFGLLALALGYCVTSHFEGMFTLEQVIEKWGRPGIAIVVHGGAWGDILLLPALCAVLTARFGESWAERLNLNLYFFRWDLSIIVLAAIIGFVITAGNHANLCANQKIPDPFGWQKQWFT